MALLKTEAEKLSQNDLLRGVIEEIIDREDLFSVLPWHKTEGKSYDYVRENTLSEGAFLDPYEAVPEEASTFTEVSTKLKIIAGDVDIDKFISGTLSDQQSQVAIQLAAKAKGMARKLRRTLAIGDSSANAKEFDGVKRLVTAGQTIGLINGGAMTLGQLDELLDAVPNGADIIMMRSGTIRAYRALLRSVGGLTPAEIMMENFGRVMLTHNGVPIIENDFLPGDEVRGSSGATTCSVYAIRLNVADGLHGIFGGGPGGLVFEDIGTVQNKDSQRFRLKWYVGTALKSTKSLARLAGVTNI